MDLSAATDRSGDEPAPRTPAMADFWPARVATPPPPSSSPSRQSQPEGPKHAAELPQPPGHDEIEPPEAPGHGRVRLTRGSVIALVLLLVIAGALATLIKQAQSQPSSSTAAPAASPPPSPESSPEPTGAASVAPAPAPGATTTATSPAAPVLPPGKVGTTSAPKLPAAAIFEVAATDASVTVRSQDLGADLYRVALAPAAAPVTAKVADAGASHRLTLVKATTTVAPPVTITLNAAVRWNLRLTAGNTETAADLTQTRLASLELAGGAHLFTLALPPVTGTLPLRITHGMNQLKITTNGVPVRLNLVVGAGKVILDGVTHTDTKPGRVLTSDGFAAATDRVDVDSIEGVGTLTVDTD